VTIGHCRRRELKKEREPVATCQDERQVLTQAWSSDRFKRDMNKALLQVALDLEKLKERLENLLFNPIND